MALSLLKLLVATEFSCIRLKQLLEWYNSASGQQVNFTNFAICFSPRVPASAAQSIASILGVNVVACHEKYFGLPCYEDQSRKEDLILNSFIKDEADSILPTSRTHHLSKDRLLWHHEQFVCYTVRRLFWGFSMWSKL
ncbi:hypothetical protein F8388_018311 [Cannabis sativa]|uniref:Uncharacterized protein n=1 Tax=Cannabis sativa TaxID=3483 RepID=A0A7J6HHF5_CANSA|nr:hypothetical protein F8388_018311 [Cannabis sativa]